MSWLKSFFGSDTGTTASKEATLLDVIIYVASLVSTPSAIDPTLDIVREISSRLGPNKTLSQSDQAALSKVYREIERYLVKEDPIRTFTPEEVRSRVTAKFPTVDISIFEVTSAQPASKNKVE